MGNIRKAGILLHPTSLPGAYGIGTFGPEAFAFIDFLQKAGQNLWQVLPLGPTGPGDSPYQSYSAFALNPMLIDLSHFIKKDLINKSDLKEAQKPNTGRVDYGFVNGSRNNIFRKAHQAFENAAPENDKNACNQFIEKHSYWLDDYALFMAIKEQMNGLPWYEWPDELRFRETQTLATHKELLNERIRYHKYLQFVANCQWMTLKEYANNKKIEVIGDIPLYVAFDSSDAWANPEVFMLDEELNPKMVAGVPPDFFSETGQLWGNVLFNWDYLKNTGFDWWIKRVAHNLELADIIRIDHFRGLIAFWAVPFGAETAIDGHWIEAPAVELFEALYGKFGKLPIIAEDLGVITPDVDAVREKFNLPGMKILQFGFDEGDSNDFLPHFYQPNSVVYTGTHDNDTIIGWYNQLKSEVKLKFHKYSGSIGSEPHWLMIRMAWASVSKMAIVPLQDVMGLDTTSRMNIPGTLINNWQWRYLEGQLPDEYAHILLDLSKLYNRYTPDAGETKFDKS
ncbi:MAG: 4-alpha-glucanotransferase [Lentimicrobium sp.]|jgi:4-alpha-glucanotransferase|nr:4-alpha-glucanotransferase [Lentimicrobium sp.]